MDASIQGGGRRGEQLGNSVAGKRIVVASNAVSGRTSAVVSPAWAKRRGGGTGGCRSSRLRTRSDGRATLEL